MPSRVAFFLDLDNLYVSVSHGGGRLEVPPLLRKAEQYGQVTVARAYANYEKIPTALQMAVLAAGIQPIHCPAIKNGQEKVKSLTDQVMQAEICRILISHRAIRTFCLGTGDVDFHPLAAMLRSQGKYVVCLAIESSTSRFLADAVDELVTYPVQSSAPSVLPGPPPATGSPVMREAILKAGLRTPAQNGNGQRTNQEKP